MNRCTALFFGSEMSRYHFLVYTYQVLNVILSEVFNGFSKLQE